VHPLHPGGPVVVVLVVLEVVDDVVELVVLVVVDDELLEVVVVGGDVLLELVVVELVVLDDELEVVVVDPVGVPSQVNVATYPSYGPSCPGGDGHVQPASQLLVPYGSQLPLSSTQIHEHVPTHPGISHPRM
jgi:hypothetical protein